MSDFDALNDEVRLYAFDILAGDNDDMRSLPLSMRKTNLARLLARRIEYYLAQMSRYARRQWDN
jgi:bifunctional non-homologous end joining protein LigD